MQVPKVEDILHVKVEDVIKQQQDTSSVLDRIYTQVYLPREDRDPDVLERCIAHLQNRRASHVPHNSNVYVEQYFHSHCLLALYEMRISARFRDPLTLDVAIRQLSEALPVLRLGHPFVTMEALSALEEAHKMRGEPEDLHFSAYYAEEASRLSKQGHILLDDGSYSKTMEAYRQFILERRNNQPGSQRQRLGRMLYNVIGRKDEGPSQFVKHYCASDAGDGSRSESMAPNIPSNSQTRSLPSLCDAILTHLHDPALPHHQNSQQTSVYPIHPSISDSLDKRRNLFRFFLARGNFLRMWFMEESGDWEILDDAVTMLEEAAVLAFQFEDDEPDARGQIMEDLCECYLIRIHGGYRSNGTLSDEEKRAWTEMAITLETMMKTDGTDVDGRMALQLFSLATLYLKIYPDLQHAADIRDLQEKWLEASHLEKLIVLGQKNLSNDGHVPSLPQVLAQLRKLRYMSSGDESDALEWYNLTLQYLENRRTLPKKLVRHDLAELYLELRTPFHNADQALNILLEDLGDQSLPVPIRLRTACMALPKLIQTTDQLTNGLLLTEYLCRAVALLPEASQIGQAIETYLDISREADNLLNYAISHVLKIRGIMASIHLLEQGRGTFWSRVHQIHSLTTTLVKEDPKDELKILCTWLEHKTYGSPLEAERRLDVIGEHSHRRLLKAQLEERLPEIRQKPGLEYFLLSERFNEQDLSELAARVQGWIVVLLASSVSCDAILIAPGRTITHVSLQEVNQEKLEEMGRSLKVSLENLRKFADSKSSDDGSTIYEGITEYYRYAPQPSPGRAGRIATSDGCDPWEVIEWLWRKIAKPVISCMRITLADGRDRPRVWWCSTGYFSMLPIHAAGLKSGPSCSNYVVSSYTPTLRTLLNAFREMAPVRRDNCQVLLGAVPRPFVGLPLPKTKEEVVRISKVIPEHAKLFMDKDDVSCDPNALGLSWLSLSIGLQTGSILHLACHGRQNPTYPLYSGFILRDRFATIRELMRIPAPSAFFAFLSACETAQGAEDRPDQAAHLAAAMLCLGFKSVVGTMWSMSDADGPEVAETVYRALFSGTSEMLDPNTIPYALDEAMCKLREGGASPIRWAPYIHMGI